MIKRLKRQSEFSRNVVTLMTGTTIAQAIPIAISPILTRVFTPSDFGVLALFVAITSVISVISTLRYELAIVQPRDDEDAAALVVLSVIVATVISLLSLILIYGFNAELQSCLGNSEVGPWLYLVPLSVFFNGLYQALNYWKTRERLFKLIAISKVNQGASTALVQVSTGLNAVGSAGLIWGHILGQLLAVLTLLNNALSDDQKKFMSVSYRKIKDNAIRYQKMPKYSTFGALTDKLSVQMPVLVITRFYDVAQTGMFSLTFRVLSLPMSLISGALSQVLFQKISLINHESPDLVREAILRLFFILLAMMIPFVGFVWLFGEDLFAIVFGEPWRQAGAMATVLVIAVAIRFSVSPLSAVLALDHNIKIGVLWQFIYFVTITTTLFYFSSFPIADFIYAFVVHEVVLYLIYLFLILKGSASLRVNE